MVLFHFRLTPKDLRANWAIKSRATWPQWRTHMRASIHMHASAKLKCVALHDCNYIMLPTAMIANALATLRCLCQPLRRADADCTVPLKHALLGFMIMDCMAFTCMISIVLCGNVPQSLVAMDSSRGIAVCVVAHDAGGTVTRCISADHEKRTTD